MGVWFRAGVSEPSGGRVSSHTHMAPRQPPRQWQVRIDCVCFRLCPCFLLLLGDELVVDSPGRVTWRRCRRRSGSTARGRPTAGATREASRRPLRDGWLRFLSLSLTGRSAWRAVSPQVRYPPLSQQLVSVRVSSLLLQFLFLQAGLSGAASGTSSKMRPRIRRRIGAARFR